MTLLLGGCALLDSGPVARFEVSPVVIYAGERVTFDASSSYGTRPIISYTWVFTDGETVAGQKADHTYTEPGHYSVTLQVKDADGRTAQVQKEILVYLPSGSDIFYEDFSDGNQALARWELDPTWASEGEGTVENLSGAHGFVLHIRSGADRWHRRSAPVILPPLRVGQRIVFSCRAMMAQTKDAHTVSIFPLRKSLDSLEGSLPYYLFTNEGGGSTIREPEAHGGDIGHPIPFIPGVYHWHTYRFVFSSDGYELYVDDTLYAAGMLSQSLAEGGEWMILLGDESHTEACDAYFDEIRVWVEE